MATLFAWFSEPGARIFKFYFSPGTESMQPTTGGNQVQRSRTDIETTLTSSARASRRHAFRIVQCLAMFEKAAVGTHVMHACILALGNGTFHEAGEFHRMSVLAT
jgi:hypothetical protein